MAENSKVRNIRFTADNDSYIVENGGDNVTAYVNSVLDMVRTGQLIVKPTDNAKGKDKEELEKEKLAVDIEIKKQIRDMNDLARKNAQADLDLKLERIRKLQRENDRAEGASFPVVVKPAVSAVPQELAKEIAKDTVTPEPRKKPSFVHELPAGQGLVGCDSCHEVFIFDNADNGLDQFLDHLKEKHPWRHEQVSSNEANQFRRARDRIAKGVPAS